MQNMTIYIQYIGHTIHNKPLCSVLYPLKSVICKLTDSGALTRTC